MSWLRKLLNATLAMRDLDNFGKLGKSLGLVFEPKWLLEFPVSHLLTGLSVITSKCILYMYIYYIFNHVVSSVFGVSRVNCSKPHDNSIRMVIQNVVSYSRSHELCTRSALCFVIVVFLYFMFGILENYCCWRLHGSGMMNGFEIVG